MLDGILASIDWSKWEAAYDGRLGQPPIHPRVLAGVLLYGLLKRIRASRALEDALAMLDVARSYGSSQLWMVNRRAFNVFFPDARASRLAEAHRFLDALILDLSKSHLGDGKQWLRDAAVRYPGLRPETYQALLSREYYYRR